MTVTMGYLYKDNPNSFILQIICENIIRYTKDIGNHNGKWYRIEFIEGIINDTLNIYYEGSLVFQANENYGDWIVNFYNMPDFLVEELERKSCN